MSEKTALQRLFYAARNWRARLYLERLKRHCHGRVVDVGGWDFFTTAAARGIRFDTWTTVEPGSKRIAIDDPRFRQVAADGCRMPFADASFDCAVSTQVLEHVFEPLVMLQEIHRVLRPGGIALVLVPQTANLHMAPHHYYNFTHFWCQKAMDRAGLEVLELAPLGGFWSSAASRMVHAVLHMIRYPGSSHVEVRRTPAYYALLPLMLVWMLVAVPVTLLLSLGDLQEEPNNHLVVARKPHG